MTIISMTTGRSRPTSKDTVTWPEKVVHKLEVDECKSRQSVKVLGMLAMLLGIGVLILSIVLALAVNGLLSQKRNIDNLDLRVTQLQQQVIQLEGRR